MGDFRQFRKVQSSLGVEDTSAAWNAEEGKIDFCLMNAFGISVEYWNRKAFNNASSLQGHNWFFTDSMQTG